MKSLVVDQVGREDYEFVASLDSSVSDEYLRSPHNSGFGRLIGATYL